MKKCLTKPLLYKGVSGCLVENPDCGHAYQFGFSYVCSHPDHAQFHAHVITAMTFEEMRERYEALRIQRRDEFLANLDANRNEYFCLELDSQDCPGFAERDTQVHVNNRRTVKDYNITRRKLCSRT